MSETKLDSFKVALRNKKFYRSIQHSRFYEWQIVALFYSALHMIDHYAEGLNQKRYADHYRRNMFVNRTRSLRPVRAQYKQLYSSSRRARYEGEVFDAKTVGDLVKTHSNIISHVCKLLRDQSVGSNAPSLH